MNLFNLFKSRSIIRKKEFFDHNGLKHIQFYLSFYKDPYSDISSDFYGISSRKEPTYEEKKAWKEQHGPQTYKGGIKEFVIKDGFVEIGEKAFGYNLNLSSIVIPPTLNIIGKEAFLSCSKLYRIDLPESIRKIGKNAFLMSELGVLYLHAKKPPKISDLGIKYDCKIYIPIESKEKYYTSIKWKKYTKQLFFF